MLCHCTAQGYIFFKLSNSSSVSKDVLPSNFLVRAFCDIGIGLGRTFGDIMCADIVLVIRTYLLSLAGMLPTYICGVPGPDNLHLQFLK